MACACGNETCGCQAPEVLYLEDEQGNAHPFYIAERLQNDMHQYVLLVSAEDAEQFALLRAVNEPGGEVHYQNIDSEAEWNYVQETLFQAQ